MQLNDFRENITYSQSEEGIKYQFTLNVPAEVIKEIYSIQEYNRYVYYHPAFPPAPPFTKIAEQYQPCYVSDLFGQFFAETMPKLGLNTKNVDTYFIRELMTNCYDSVRFGGTPVFTLVLKKTKDTFKIKLKDRGVGFDSSLVGVKSTLFNLKDVPLKTTKIDDFTNENSGYLGGQGCGLKNVYKHQKEDHPQSDMFIKNRRQGGSSVEIHIPLKACELLEVEESKSIHCKL